MDLWKLVNSVTYNKEDLLVDVPDYELNGYPQFMMNRAISYYIDCLEHAQEMNMRPGIDPRQHFDFYKYSLIKKKRYSSWIKTEKEEYLDIVKEFFGYSVVKAKETLKLLSLEQLKEIKMLLQRE